MAAGKIPVFRSVGSGIQFLFVRFFRILRVSIVPALIAGAVMFALHWFILPAIPGSGLQSLGGDGLRNPYYGLPLAALYVGAVAMFTIGLAKAYFDKPIGGLYASFGAPEWRFIGATTAVAVLTVFIYFLPVVGLAWVLFNYVDFSSVPQQMIRHVEVVTGIHEQDMSMIIVTVLAGMALAIFYVFVAFRLSLFLPVIIQERRLGIRRSWTLMRGNVWRLIFVILFLAVAFAVILFPVLLGTFVLLGAVSGGDLDKVSLDGRVTIDSFLTLPGFILLLANAFTYLLFMSLYVGALGFAYEKLTEDEAAAA